MVAEHLLCKAALLFQEPTFAIILLFFSLHISLILILSLHPVTVSSLTWC